MKKIIVIAGLALSMAGCVAYVDPAGPGAYIGLPPVVVAPAPVIVAPRYPGWGWHGGWRHDGQRGGWHRR